MRILLVSDFYPPFIGGTERQVQLLGRELAQRGHEVHVATVWHAGLPENETDQGVSIHRIKGMATRVPWFFQNQRRRFHPPFPDMSITAELRRLIRQLQPDIVHAFGWITYSCVVANRATSCLVVSVQDYGHSCALRTLIHQKSICTGPAPAKCLRCAQAEYGIGKAVAAVAGVLGNRRMLRKRIHGFHCLSHYVEHIVRRDLIGASSYEGVIRTIAPIVIPNAHEEITEDVQAHVSQLPQEPFILFVGALLPHKGIDVLLDAYTQVRAAPPLVLIGSVWAQSPTQFPEKVILLRDVPSSVVMLAWERCLFGVSPSTWAEPFGGVVTEGMSKGKAVIGSTVGGHSDMIDHAQTGLLVAPNDADALRDAMQFLIDHAEQREQFGYAAGRRVQEKFLADHIVVQIEDLYNQVQAVANHRRAD
jgi:glycosyltransferase involved in cell wall biosynthesis